MKIAIVFDSKTGNTELVAGAIREACAGQEIVAFGPPPADVSQADLVFVGSWVDKGTCTSPLSPFNQSLAGKRVAVFGTAGFGGDAAYAAKLFERSRASLPQDAQVIGYFYCLGKMRLESREKYVALLREHPGGRIAVGFHGTALSTVLHHYDPAFGFDEFWDMSERMPWCAHLSFEGEVCAAIETVDLSALSTYNRGTDQQ